MVVVVDGEVVVEGVDGVVVVLVCAYVDDRATIPANNSESLVRFMVDLREM
jgi:hypothetical protein